MSQSAVSGGDLGQDERSASRRAFEVVIAEDADAAAALETSLGETDDARIVRIGNRLRSPLSLSRVLAQIGYLAPVDVDEHQQNPDAATLLSALYGVREDESRVILVVEQAHSLTEDACRFLWQLSRVKDSNRLPLQVICVGTGALWRTLAGALGADVARGLGRPEETPPRETAVPAEVAVAAGPVGRSRRPVRLGAMLLALAVAGGGVWLKRPELTAPAQPSAPSAAAPVTDAAVAAPTAAAVPQPAAPSAEPLAVAPTAPPQVEASQFGPVEPPAGEIARLHREFDAFLSQDSGIKAPLTPEQREQLFQDYLLSRARH